MGHSEPTNHRGLALKLVTLTLILILAFASELEARETPLPYCSPPRVGLNAEIEHLAYRDQFELVRQKCGDDHICVSCFVSVKERYAGEVWTRCIPGKSCEWLIGEALRSYPFGKCERGDV